MPSWTTSPDFSRLSEASVSGSDSNRARRPYSSLIMKLLLDAFQLEHFRSLHHQHDALLRELDRVRDIPDYVERLATTVEIVARLAELEAQFPSEAP